MEQVGNLVKTTVDEIEKALSTKTVVGEPMIIEGNTIIPLISIGFAFGAGGGSGKGVGQKDKGEGEGMAGGAGGGAGVKPVGIIVANKDGVKIVQIKGAMASTAEKIAEVVDDWVTKREDRKQEKKEKK
jgi:uncharacterized spore protein YtfJ